MSASPRDSAVFRSELDRSELSPEARDEVARLVRAELEGARQRLLDDARELRSGATLIAVAGALLVVAAAVFDVAVVLLIGGTVGSALLITGIVIAEVLLLGYLGYRKLPRRLFERSRSR